LPHSEIFALQHSDLNAFLYADVGTEQNDMTLHVMSGGCGLAHRSGIRCAARDGFDVEARRGIRCTSLDLSAAQSHRGRRCASVTREGDSLPTHRGMDPVGKRYFVGSQPSGEVVIESEPASRRRSFHLPVLLQR
jgi:hypothetical protein